MSRNPGDVLTYNNNKQEKRLTDNKSALRAIVDEGLKIAI